MKNLLMILGVLGIVLTINRAYSQNSSKISFDTVMVQKYGQTFSDGAILTCDQTNKGPDDSRFFQRQIPYAVGASATTLRERSV